MKLLALDTSSLACTVGLLVDGRRVVRHEERARQHTRLLVPMIRDVLDEAGVELRDCDAIVLGNGPGSFIGLRIAASVAQGLAFGAGLPIVPVSSMAAVAVAAGAPGDVVVVTQDAHMNEVYVGVYEIDADQLARETVPEQLVPVGALDALTGVDAAIAAGYGWTRYPGLLPENASRIAALSPELYPNAPALLAIGAREFSAGRTIDAERVAPAYLRHKVAQPPS
ncbi:MAG: tRNA (adenosine(37)-N6)-threonylcarbamoyltransferase complex dimerization subunit type 1 TsaB [Woeseiaceae bacterium]|nr:tRNA (adenosine(37)-N6)-threonylcarbamoyltransferase complex dimerization subunit type 1 TsaB [Woeseiaceae bacterium]